MPTENDMTQPAIPVSTHPRLEVLPGGRNGSGANGHHHHGATISAFEPVRTESRIIQAPAAGTMTPDMWPAERERRLNNLRPSVTAQISAELDTFETRPSAAARTAAMKDVFTLCALRDAEHKAQLAKDRAGQMFKKEVDH